MTTVINPRVKKHILGKPHEAVLRFPKGWQDVCLDEVRELIANPCGPLKFQPEVRTEQSAILVSNIGYRSLLELMFRLRTARDLLWLIHRGRAGSVGEVIAQASKVPWELILPQEFAVALRVTSTASRVFHEGLISEVLCGVLTKAGYRCVDRKSTCHLIDVRLIDNQISFFLSMAGAPLYRRGYKAELRGLAPLKEDIAAAAVRFTISWAAELLGRDACLPARIYVPFGGSGTLGFETILYLGSIPSFLFGRSFSAAAFRCSPSKTIENIQKRLLGVSIEQSFRNSVSSSTQQGHTSRVVFVEIDKLQAETLRQNAASFTSKLEETGIVCPGIETIQGSFSEHPPPLNDTLFIPLNPPYGGRIKDNSKGKQIYGELGEQTKSLAKGRLVYGFLLAPDEQTQNAFCKHLRSFKQSRRSIIHGGKRIRFVAFLSS